MQHRSLGITELIRRAWWRLHGERPLLTTFWPQDYQRGALYQLDDQSYEITRYVRAADGRFFEVWGRPLAEQPPEQT